MTPALWMALACLAAAVIIAAVGVASIIWANRKVRCTCQRLEPANVSPRATHVRVIPTGAERGSARRRLTPELLREVAKVYREADGAPRQTVAAKFQTPPDNASKMIRAAREQGYLGESRGPGLAGEKGDSSRGPTPTLPDPGIPAERVRGRVK